MNIRDLYCQGGEILVLNFDKKGYQYNDKGIPLYSQLALSGNSRGLTLNVQVTSVTEKHIQVQTFINDTNLIDTKSPAYLVLLDQFNGSTKMEKEQWYQFGINAIRYEYIVEIKKANRISNNSYNYELVLEVKRKRENLCKI